MLLIAYWRILRRRIWIPLLLAVLVLALHLATFRPPAPTYTAAMRFAVGMLPEESYGMFYTYDRYYTWLTSEYLVDDLAEVVKSNTFASTVSAGAGMQVPPGAITAATAAGKLHRILWVNVTWGNRQELEQIAAAVVDTLQSGSHAFFGQLHNERTIIIVVDQPTISQNNHSQRMWLELALKLIVTIITGILLAFLLDYIDTSVRSRHDLEALNLPVLAEIPRSNRRSLGLTRLLGRKRRLGAG
ncbi:MAG: hypothetical protein GXY52_07920 [Chloroflexi bacterium]|nr:hypothetical protein [Chloroflexota bacterium]